MNERSEERDREYGGFTDSMIKAAKIAELLMNKEFTTTDMFKAMIALKLSRLAYSPKFDSMVDLIGYTEGWNNYINDPRFKITTEEDLWNETRDVINIAAEKRNTWEKEKKMQVPTAEHSQPPPKKKQSASNITLEQQKEFDRLIEITKAIRTLEGEGYRVYGPDKNESTASLDWKDQHGK